MAKPKLHQTVPEPKTAYAQRNRSIHRDNIKYRPPKIGAVLLDLRDALVTAERCRRALGKRQFSLERWLEIVRDIDPNLRFMVRPQILDAIVTYLQSAQEPPSRKVLVHELALQGVGTMGQIDHAMANHLRSGKLLRFADDTIGLPPEKQKGHR